MKFFTLFEMAEWTEGEEPNYKYFISKSIFDIYFWTDSVNFRYLLLYAFLD